MPKTPISFDYFLLMSLNFTTYYINLHGYRGRYLLLGLFPITRLSISGLSPAVDGIVVVDSDGMVRTTSNSNDGGFLKYFDILRVIVFEEMSNVMRRTNRLHIL